MVLLIAALALSLAAESAQADSAPVNTVAPSITRTPEVGETLPADPGNWTGTLGYQWQRCEATVVAGVDCTSQAPSASNQWQAVAQGAPKGEERLVAVSDNGTDPVMTSPDDVTWTARTAAAGSPRFQSPGAVRPARRNSSQLLRNGAGGQVMISPRVTRLARSKR